MLPASAEPPRSVAKGFTLFEMVVVICSIAILYMVAERRINELPAAAERASFNAVLEQIKAGVNLAMFGRLAGGEDGGVTQLAGTNPMDRLLESPSNYLGELEQVTDLVRRRGAWYFEKRSGQLVYVVGGSSIRDVWVTLAGIPVNLGQIRFRIENVYDDGLGGLLHGERQRDWPDNAQWEGVQLVPVNAYRWEARSEAELGSIVGQ